MIRREYPDAPIVGVGGVVIEGDQVLLVRRGQEPMKGEWSLPGGVLELGETLESGILREIHEETGLLVEVLQVLEVLDKIVFEDRDVSATTGEGSERRRRAAENPSFRRIRYHYVLIDFLCATSSGSLRSGSDALEAQWVTQGDLNSGPLSRMAPVTLEVIKKGFKLFQARVNRYAGE
ncbi:Nudix hydrolase family protein [Acidisarcina polymorpha]|uniref:Nudix hydrolase family protein n=1 Tax=Acidisarcina polymorpha TaxID=2211140 RepID=A0A2Z5G2Y2_9BACT|nr:NUDIX domain-containing protein [Acidisarcina polymorpha]AXC13419.1 Nudix hydrolase family protein [Acidisarcina polymorpha]